MGELFRGSPGLFRIREFVLVESRGINGRVWRLHDLVYAVLVEKGFAPVNEK